MVLAIHYLQATAPYSFLASAKPFPTWGTIGYLRICSTKLGVETEFLKMSDCGCSSTWGGGYDSIEPNKHKMPASFIPASRIHLEYPLASRVTKGYPHQVMGF